MHQLIHAIVDAQTREDALGVARGSVFDRLVGATCDGRREFDYYVTFDQEDTTVAGKARWGDLPIATRLNSADGQELLAGVECDESGVQAQSSARPRRTRRPQR